MKLIEGKKLNESILDRLAEQISQNISLVGRAPTVEIIMVGEDFASQKYVQMKSAAANKIGANCNIRQLPANIYEADLIAQIESFNNSAEVDAVMIQLPLPKSLDKQRLLDTISPSKDVDGLTSANLGLLFKNPAKAIVPATVRGVVSLLETNNILVEGKDVVLVGASDLIGIPLSAVLLDMGATVTLTHIKTVDLQTKTSQADILISAVGQPGLITKEHLKQDAIVIDIGTSQNKSTGKIVGDVRFEEIESVASMATPVPGGVGPMTVASLMQNLVDLWLSNV